MEDPDRWLLRELTRIADLAGPWRTTTPPETWPEIAPWGHWGPILLRLEGLVQCLVAERTRAAALARTFRHQRTYGQHDWDRAADAVDQLQEHAP